MDCYQGGHCISYASPLRQRPMAAWPALSQFLSNHVDRDCSNGNTKTLVYNANTAALNTCPQLLFLLSHASYN